MARNPRYDILFEPVKIGPVTSKNRFYQVPYANGAGNSMPHTSAAMREVKAEGGWGVVNTGYCSIHPSSDDSPLPHSRLWDDNDVKTHSLMVEAVHRHGALAGVELWHGGNATGNRLPWMNRRGDEYGGPLENRVRLLREMIEETKEAVGDTCAVAVRFSTDELLKVRGQDSESEAHEVVAMLADLPDLWDVKLSDG